MAQADGSLTQTDDIHSSNYFAQADWFMLHTGNKLAALHVLNYVSLMPTNTAGRDYKKLLPGFVTSYTPRNMQQRGRGHVALL